MTTIVVLSSPTSRASCVWEYSPVAAAARTEWARGETPRSSSAAVSSVVRVQLARDSSQQRLSQSGAGAASEGCSVRGSAIVAMSSRMIATIYPHKIVLYETICYGRNHDPDLDAARHHDACRRSGRTEPLDRPRRPLRRDADDHPRPDDRERGAALDPERPRLLAVGARVGRQRLPHRIRRAAPARRPPRRPRRAPARLPRRPDALHARLAAVRRRPEPGRPRRRALRAGRRRRVHLRRDPRHDRHAVPAPGRAGEGDRRLLVRRRRRRLDRPARRRRAHRGAELALDLLRQRPDRDRDRRPAPGACSPTRTASASTAAPTSPARC